MHAPADRAPLPFLVSSSTRQVSAREVRSAQLPSRVLGALRAAPLSCLGAQLRPPEALLSSRLRPLTGAGAGPEAGPGRWGGACTGTPGSAAASPAGLAAGKRLGPSSGLMAAPALRRSAATSGQSWASRSWGSWTAQPGFALRGQAEAGGEQRPGGQEPADQGQVQQTVAEETAVFAGNGECSPAVPYTALILPFIPSLAPVHPQRPVASSCFFLRLQDPGSAHLLVAGPLYGQSRLQAQTSLLWKSTLS